MNVKKSIVIVALALVLSLACTCVLAEGMPAGYTALDDHWFATTQADFGQYVVEGMIRYPGLSQSYGTIMLKCANPDHDSSTSEAEFHNFTVQPIPQNEVDHNYPKAADLLATMSIVKSGSKWTWACSNDTFRNLIVDVKLPDCGKGVDGSITIKCPGHAAYIEDGIVYVEGSLFFGWKGPCKAATRTYVWPQQHAWKSVTYNGIVAEWVEKKPATCLEGGILVRECERCGKTEEKVTDKKGHEWGEDVPTTTNVYFQPVTKGVVPVDANGLVITVDHAKIEKPTCTTGIIAKTVTTHTCVACQTVEEVGVPQFDIENAQFPDDTLAGHLWGGEVATEDVKPTCTEDGHQKGYQLCYECKNAKKYFDYTSADREELKALGHDFKDVPEQRVEVDAANCSTKGTYNVKCSRCDALEPAGDTEDAKLYTSDFDYTRHPKTASFKQISFEGEQVTASDGSTITACSVKPTCNNSGYFDYLCLACGRIAKDHRVIIPATGHNYTQFTYDGWCGVNSHSIANNADTRTSNVPRKYLGKTGFIAEPNKTYKAMYDLGVAENKAGCAFTVKICANCAMDDEGKYEAGHMVFEWGEVPAHKYIVQENDGWYMHNPPKPEDNILGYWERQCSVCLDTEQHLDYDAPEGYGDSQSGETYDDDPSALDRSTFILDESEGVPKPTYDAAGVTVGEVKLAPGKKLPDRAVARITWFFADGTCLVSSAIVEADEDEDGNVKYVYESQATAPGKTLLAIAVQIQNKGLSPLRPGVEIYSTGGEYLYQ